MRRIYDPEDGDWLGRDPIGLASGQVNPTDYAGNDPINGTDPSGLKIYLLINKVGGSVHGHATILVVKPVSAGTENQPVGAE
jgi:uncharacterized protein RhaS with RHS repeats